jgi:hypothetical protein
MIYQFENDEIKKCIRCPMWVFPEMATMPLCNLTGETIPKGSTPQENDCPLVAISKTETARVVSDGFSYDAKPKQFQCRGCRDYFYMPRVGNYCPNCGRRLA